MTKLVAIITSPALPPIWMNSLVIISTISLTWKWINEIRNKKKHKKHDKLFTGGELFPNIHSAPYRDKKSKSTLPIYPLFTGFLPLLEFSFRFYCLFLSLWPLPPFLSKLLSIHPQVRALRFSNQRILDVPRTRSKTEGIGPFQL